MVASRSGRRPGRESRGRTRRRTSPARSHRTRLGQPRARLPDGGAPPADARRARRAPPRLHPGAAIASAHRLDPRALSRAWGGRARPPGRTLSRPRGASTARTRSRRFRRMRRGTSVARTAFPTSPILCRELLRPRAGRGLRVRGANLLPRRNRRAADATIHPLARSSCRLPEGELRRRGEACTAAPGLAETARGR